MFRGPTKPPPPSVSRRTDHRDAGRFDALSRSAATACAGTQDQRADDARAAARPTDRDAERSESHLVRIKPYDSKLSILEEPPLRPNHPLKRPIPEVKKAQTNGVDVNDKQAERGLKYFLPKPQTAVPATNGTLMVNGDDRASLVQRKPSYGQTKPMASPKMGVKSLMNRTVHPGIKK